MIPKLVKPQTLEGADRYASAELFPVSDALPVRFYLATGGSDKSVHRLVSDGAPKVGSSNSWAAIPVDAPVLGGLDDVTNQILTYEAIVEKEVEFSGPVSAHLKFSCNEIDSHLVARLGRVDKDGGYHLLSMGTISPARRRLDVSRSTSCEIAIDTGIREPLEPGVPVTLGFSLTPAPTRLLPGERLRFDVASRTDLLKSDPSHGHAHFDLPAPPYYSRNTLHYGAESFLQLQSVR